MIRRRRTRTADRPHMLAICNNNVPTDRRMWLECIALRDDGIQVSVICPDSRGGQAYEVVDGVEIHRYRPTARNGPRAGFVLSYLTSFVHTARLAVTVWRRHRFAVIQACNPPDIFFAVAVLFRPFGVRFVFDQHDLSPEIYQDRFVGGSSRVHSALLAFERLTHRCAAHVITVNESCRDLLLARTSTPPDRLTVTRTGPDLARLRRVAPQRDLKQGRRFLVGYLGVMGPQDGVDMILRAIDVLVHRLDRRDVHFVLLGDGQCLAELRSLAEELGVTDWVTFTGWADDATICAALSTCDLALQPDRRTPFTELCTMLKTVEYMAFGLPVVTFDLLETRRTAGDAAVYVATETPEAYAWDIVALLEDPLRRRAMSARALRRARTELAWDTQRDGYLAVLRHALGMPARHETPQRTSGHSPEDTMPDSPTTVATAAADHAGAIS